MNIAVDGNFDYPGISKCKQLVIICVCVCVHHHGEKDMIEEKTQASFKFSLYIDN